jgi:hypothetical protein
MRIRPELYERVEVLNLDPPVLVIEDLIPSELCDTLRSAAEASGQMARSRLGGGLSIDESMPVSERRTSSSMLIGPNYGNSEQLLVRSPLVCIPQLHYTSGSCTPDCEAPFQLLLPRTPIGYASDIMSGHACGGGAAHDTTPHDACAHAKCVVQGLADQVQSIIKGVFDGVRWGPACTVPKSGSMVLEGLQVAKYEQGEHFLSHEDGFPKQLAEEQQFQRRATVLLYLNDVAEGGETVFDWLGLSITPQKGKALIFFPSFANGLPDDRTLHAAQDAVEQKWVAQQWVAARFKTDALAPVDPLQAAADRAALLRAGVGKPRDSLLGKGGKQLPMQQGVVGAQARAVNEVMEAEVKAKASISKRKRKGKPATGTSKGFGS